MKPITVTFKKGEEDLCQHARDHSSPAAYIKDLIKKDMDKEVKNDTKGNDTSLFDL